MCLSASRWTRQTSLLLAISWAWQDVSPPMKPELTSAQKAVVLLDVPATGRRSLSRAQEGEAGKSVQLALHVGAAGAEDDASGTGSFVDEAGTRAGR